MKAIDILAAGTKARHMLVQLCRPTCLKYGINQTGYEVVMFLVNNPEYNTARDICLRRGLKSGLVSVTVDRLLELGYLLRTEDMWDGRIKRLYLTDKAQPLVEEIKENQKRFLDILGQGLTREERHTFQLLTERIVHNIMDNDDPPAGAK